MDTFMKTITFLNSKGGVGKTTLCLNVAHALTYPYKSGDSKKKTILVDADPQGSLRDWHNAGASLNADCADDLICADTRQSLISSYRLAEESGCELLFVDTTGQMHVTLGCALSFTDLAIIPLQPSPLDVWATIDCIDLINNIMRSNPKFKALFVINMATVNSAINHDVFEALKEAAPNIPIAPQVIHGRVVFARSISSGKTVFKASEPKRDIKAISEITKLSEYILELLYDQTAESEINKLRARQGEGEHAA